MKKINKLCLLLFFISTIQTINSSTVLATLYLTSYEPFLSFKLVFSQPVQLPNFQILLNNNNLSYVMKTQSNFTDTYQMTLKESIHIYNLQIQAFSLIFNYPLNVANGRLSLGSYILQPIRAPIILTLSNWPVYLLLFFTYFFSLSGIIGLWLIDFIQIFILMEYRFQHTTTIYQFIGNTFFFNKRSSPILQTQYEKYIIQLFTPLIIVISAFFISLIIKQILKSVTSLYLLHLRYFFAYNFFLTVWSVLSAPILYKVFQFISLSNSGLIFFTSNQQISCVFITYMNILSTFLYIYLMWFSLNRKPFQQQQAFQEFLQSQDFQQFEKFNKAINMNSWHKRNYIIFTTLRKLSVVVIFFVSFITLADKVLAQQIILMFYVFIARPFKQQFYVNSSIIINLLLFFCFLIIVDGNVFFNMSDFLVTEVAINDYLIAKNIVFLVVCVTILVFSCIQNYKSFQHVRYQIKLFSESQSKSTNFQNLQQSTARKRLYTKTSQGSITKRMAKRSHIPQLQNMSASIIFNRDSPPKLNAKTLQQKDKNTSSKARLNLFEIQMQQLKSPQIFKKRNSLGKLNNNLKSSVTFKKVQVQQKHRQTTNLDKHFQKKNNFKNNLNLNSNNNANNMMKNDKKWRQKSLLEQLADNKSDSPNHNKSKKDQSKKQNQKSSFKLQ